MVFNLFSRLSIVALATIENENKLQVVDLGILAN